MLAPPRRNSSPRVALVEGADMKKDQQTGSKASTGQARAARALVLSIVESLPQAEAPAHGLHLSLEVRGKRFAWFLEDHHGDGRLALHCKSSEAARAGLMRRASEHAHVPKYVGHRGWVGLWLDVPGLDDELVRSTLTEAYRLTAPKALAARLSATATDSEPRDTRRAQPTRPRKKAAR